MVRPLARQKGVSALLPKADMCGATRDVRFVPIADIETLPVMTNYAASVLRMLSAFIAR